MAGAPAQISLPKGGGAIRGLGETFQPDPQTGTGSYDVALDVPAGRNGIQPALTLSYSTGNPNGPFGLGWRLAVPGVRRRTSRGVPRYNDTDVFVLSETEDLVPVPGGAPDRARYRQRGEGPFCRIERVTTARQDHWEVWDRDGLRSRYGTARPPDAPDDWRDPAAVVDPADPRRVFSWLLSETTDPFGNRVVYSYERDEAADGYDQLYLADIRYVDHGDPAAPRYGVRIAFAYEPRADVTSDRRARFEVRTARRCARVETWTQAGDEPVLARTVYLDYASAGGNALSLLRQIRVVGHDGELTQQLPPLEFGYTGFDPADRRFRTVTGTDGDLPATSLADPALTLVDLFGNGLPCVLQMNGDARYWRNAGDARLRAPRRMPAAPGVGLGDPGVQLADVNGDGRADLLVATPELAGHYPLTFDGRFADDGFLRHPRTPASGLDDPALRLIDLDGDGVADAMRTGAVHELYFNRPGRGFDRVETRPAGSQPAVSFEDTRVKLADMSGDGLTDVLLVQDRSLRYWPQLGHGRFGAQITMAGAPHFDDGPGFDPRRVLLGDIDGDGCADVVYVGDGRVTVWLNQSGVRFAEPVTIHGTPLTSDGDAVRLVDLLGTGTEGVLWTYDAGTRRDAAYKFLDLTGNTKPYLLRTVDNHMGAHTTIEYEPSTRHYLAAERAGRPWATTLPFPVQVVARTTVRDTFSDTTLTSEYRYHHGHWDGADREFRGFARVDQLDKSVTGDVNTSPPTESRTWFHIGPVASDGGDWAELDLADEYWPGDPRSLGPTVVDVSPDLPRRALREVFRALRGAVLRTELYALDDDPARGDRPFTVTEHRYRVAAVLDGRTAAEDWSAGPVVVAHAIAERETAWDRGDDPMHRFTYVDGHDEYGLPSREITVAVPRGRDYRVAGAPGAPYLATRTVTTYARRDDADRYIVDRVATSTTHEILNDGSPTLSELLDAVTAGTARLAVSAQTLHHYDGGAFVGLALGRLGYFGALVRTESLVLTEDLLRAAYGSPIPPYLEPAGPPAWTEDYPAEWRDRLPALAGYTVGGQGSERGYFAQKSRQRYDFQASSGPRRGLVTATRDPIGHDSTVVHDPLGLLPVRVTDPAGLTTTAVLDYRVLQPALVTDANGNRAAFRYTPLGLLAGTAAMGKEAEPVGDTPETPGTRLVYSLSAFDDSPPEQRQPVSVRTIRRVHHVGDGDAPPTKRDETIETVEYSDGFGRLVQTRVQTADVTFGERTFGGRVLPGPQDDPTTQRPVAARSNADRQSPNVVVSGWQVYDDKGRLIEKYEPFFATGWVYDRPIDAQLGQRARMFYDPRGRLVRTVNPDGSEQRILHGVPPNLANPGRFTPTPWETYMYDANDNAGRTHLVPADGYRHQWNTPASVEVDALGRTVRSTRRHRPPPEAGADPLQPPEELHTRHAYDIRGNPTVIIDAAGRPAFRYVYDLSDRPLRTENIDAGVRRTVLDAASDEIERRDGKGAQTLRSYDALRRPVSVWARDDGAGGVTLRQRLEYGDGGAPNQLPAERAAGRAANRLGELHRHYDEAGLLTIERYDFKGNVLDKTRRVIADDVLLAAFPSPGDPTPDWRVAPYRVDWQPSAGTAPDAHADALLEPTGYQSTAGYDALSRVTRVRHPQDVNGGRVEVRPAYNRAGACERVSLEGRTVVERIAYNARGQRTLVALGNGVLTRHAYEVRTFQLIRLRTERWAPTPDGLSYQPTGAALQDLGYRYDLAGNVLDIVDRTPGSGVAGNPEAGTIDDPDLRALVARGDALVRRFGYDSLDRLTLATGRECADGEQSAPWSDARRCGFNSPNHGTPNQDNAPNLTAVYRGTYAYDAVGNLTRLRHGDLVRDFALVPGTNRLRALTVGATALAYAYDAGGNVIGETDTRHFEWDHGDRLKAFRTQAGTAEPSVYVQYLYDAAGQRVKKLVRRQGGDVAVTTYIDGTFEHHRWSERNGASVGANNHVHVTDGQQRVAVVRVGAPHADDRRPDTLYHLGDHLGSSAVVVDADGGFVNREEFTPYGESTFGGFARKRFRFTGHERDDESGLSYHGARYYAPWLGRWTSCDPAGAEEGPNPYVYVGSNPMLFVDPHGTQQMVAPRAAPPTAAPAAASAAAEASPTAAPAAAPTRLGSGVAAAGQGLAALGGTAVALYRFMRNSGSIARYGNFLGVPRDSLGFGNLLQHSRMITAQAPRALPTPVPLPAPPSPPIQRKARPEVGIDTSALGHALTRPFGAQVDAALAGRAPVVSKQAFREFVRTYPLTLVMPLAIWLVLRGGRFSQIEGRVSEVWNLTLVAPQHIKIDLDDARVVAGALAENLDLVTGDVRQHRFVDYMHKQGLLPVSSTLVLLPNSRSRQPK